MRAISIRAFALTAAVSAGACELVVPSKDDLSGGTALADAGAGAPTDGNVDGPSPPPDGGGGASLVQQKSGTATNTNTLTVTLGAAPRDGDALVISVAMFAATTPTITVSGGGVTWAQRTKASAHIVSSVFTGVGARNGVASVTVMTSGVQERLVAHLSEWSGASSFGTAATMPSGGSGSPFTASLDVPDGIALVYASAATHMESFGPPANGFVSLDTVFVGDTQILAAYRLAPARGAYTTSWTESAPMGNSWDSHILSLAR